MKLANEPAVVIGAIVTVVQLIAPGLVVFGIVDWNADQLAFVASFVTAVAGAVGAFFVRGAVVPVAKLNQ